jgi:hypothetical protein
MPVILCLSKSGAQVRTLQQLQGAGIVASLPKELIVKSSDRNLKICTFEESGLHCGLQPPVLPESGRSSHPGADDQGPAAGGARAEITALRGFRQAS